MPVTAVAPGCLPGRSAAPPRLLVLLRKGPMLPPPPPLLLLLLLPLLPPAPATTTINSSSSNATTSASTSSRVGGAAGGGVSSSSTRCAFTAQAGMLLAGSDLKIQNFTDLLLAQKYCSANVLCRAFTFQHHALAPPPASPNCFRPDHFEGQTVLVYFKLGVVQIIPNKKAVPSPSPLQLPWSTVTKTEVSAAVFVKTSLGVLRGTRSYRVTDGPTTSIDQFLGIRYAEPMINGQSRWRHPNPKAPWNGTLDALDYGNACTSQSQLPGRVLFAGKPCAEDCLTLNIWSPNVSSQVLLPVLVWVHGGSFLQGSGSDTIDADGPGNGTEITRARRDLLIVTINYRLGVFGFLGANQLRGRTHDNSTGNYGQADQREALRWVQTHIAAFGGDKERVLLMGESAGAGSGKMPDRLNVTPSCDDCLLHLF